MNKITTDLSTIGGIAMAFSFVGGAIFLGGNAAGFIDIPSVLIVVLGTYALTGASFSFNEVVSAQKVLIKTIFYSSEDPKTSAFRAIEVAETARKKGFLGLQNFEQLYKHNPLLDEGVRLAIDGMPPEEIETILSQEINALIDRHSKTSSILRKSAEISPAMGLIGTLIGLVQMLGQLNAPEKIGPAMAVALLTTFYGAIMAYVVFLPLAAKLDKNTKEEAMVMKIYLKAVDFIAKKESPRKLEITLNSILPPEKRVKYFK